MSTPSRLSNETSTATGPSENLRITRSSVTGPMDGVTPVVKNSLTGLTGKNRRATCVTVPPTMNPQARVMA
jgi:hypothetical protein